MKHKFIYVIICISYLIMSSIFIKNYFSEIETSKQIFQNNHKIIIENKAKEIEQMFKYIYQGMRTISLLPDVRNMDKNPNNFNFNARMTLQQIYNNIFLNVSISELYLLQPDLEPDKIDPLTGKNQTPMLEFDDIHTNESNTSSNDNAENKEEGEHSEKIEKIEIIEYRIMKKQLSWLSSTYPTNKSFNPLQIPALTSPEIITCDNTEFTLNDLQTGNNTPRMGIVYTVPFYNNKGQLDGAVSAIIRSNVLRKLINTENMGLINQSSAIEIGTKFSEPWHQAKPYFQKSLPSPDLIASFIRPLDIKDTELWQLQYAVSNNEFWNLADVQRARTLLDIELILTLIIFSLIFLFTFKSFKFAASISRRKEQLQKRNDSIQLILDNAGEGFLTVNLSGIVEAERSSILDKWFGIASPDVLIWDYLYPKSQKQCEAFQFKFEQLVSDVFAFNQASEQMPSLINQADKTYEIAYRPILINERLDKILLIVKDITEIITNERQNLTALLETYID